MSSHTEFSTPEEKRMLHFLPGAAGQQGTGDSALLFERFILLSLKKKKLGVLFFHLQNSTLKIAPESPIGGYLSLQLCTRVN